MIVFLEGGSFTIDFDEFLLMVLIIGVISIILTLFINLLAKLITNNFFPNKVFWLIVAIFTSFFSLILGSVCL